MASEQPPPSPLPPPSLPPGHTPRISYPFCEGGGGVYKYLLELHSDGIDVVVTTDR